MEKKKIGNTAPILLYTGDNKLYKALFHSQLGGTDKLLAAQHYVLRKLDTDTTPEKGYRHY